MPPDQQHPVTGETAGGCLEVEPEVEQVPARLVVQVVPPGRHVHRHLLAGRQANPLPDRSDRIGPARRAGRRHQRVVAGVAGLADLTAELESLAHDRRAERVRRQQHVPLGNVTGHEVEVPPAAR